MIPIEEYDDGEIEYELGKASDALETLYVLRTVQDAKKDEADYTVSEEKIVNLALEAYSSKYGKDEGTPVAALEAIDTGMPTTTTSEKIKKTIDYLFSLARHILTFFIDYVKSNRHKAKRLIGLTKEFIGRADGVNGTPVPISTRSIMNALQIDGKRPENVTQLYTTLYQTAEALRKYNSVPELIRAISRSKIGDLDETRKDVEAVRQINEQAMRSCMENLGDPQRSFAFNGSRTDCEYFLSPHYFGSQHIAGYISSEVKNDGSFLIDCSVRRDPERPLVVGTFESMKTTEIRDVCRAIQKFCYSTISSSGDDAALSRLLREATFVAGTNADLTTVLSLRSLASVSKGPYMSYMQLTMRTSRALLAFCGESLTAYEKKMHGEMQ